MAVVRADPVYRRNVVIGCLAAFAVGAIAIAFGVPALRGWLEHQHPPNAVRTLRLVVVAAFAPALPMAAWLILLARRIDRAGQFPLPNTRVAVDTVVVEGAEARRVARMLLWLGVFIAAATVLGMAWSWIAVGRLVAAW
jgi:hypothetical protein